MRVLVEVQDRPFDHVVIFRYRESCVDRRRIELVGCAVDFVDVPVMRTVEEWIPYHNDEEREQLRRRMVAETHHVAR